AICLKAMASRPHERYASARALGEDIERYLADEPVEALIESIGARLWRWMRRHRAAVLGSGAVLAVLAAALGAGVVLLGAANRRAQSNFEMARDAIRDYYDTIRQDELLDQPRLRALRQRLLQRARDYYEQFLAAQRSGGAISDELAQASFAVGQIAGADGVSVHERP
ncbi:MAG TPA: hypothetical protein PJ982_08850, partial [Lacipirellulaceae bacterium]|nr:hypothetical protein [Lacipirellulaceae bacterium]